MPEVFRMVSSLSDESLPKATRMAKSKDMGRLYKKREGRRRQIKSMISPNPIPLLMIKSTTWNMRPRSRTTVMTVRMRKKEESISFTR